MPGCERPVTAEVKCAACGRVLTPYDTRVQDDGKSYCPACYGKNAFEEERRRAAGKRAPGPRGGVDFFNQRGTTALREPGKLFECENCGYVVTRDRLETFPKDARGKLRCLRCGRKFIPAEPAPAKAKQAISKPEKPGAEDFAATAQLFKCLGDPCRVKIIESLSEKELCVFQFVDLTGSQYSAISYHLKMLKELGIVQSSERGNFMVYSLTDKGQIVHEFIGKSKGLR